MPSIAIATCERLPDLDPDEWLLVDALRRRQAQVEVVVWTDPDVSWDAYDVVVVRSTWDYTENAPEFVSWARSVDQVSRLLNPAEVIAWNTDKRYLRDLAAAGIQVVPTSFIEPGDAVSIADLMSNADGEVVIKPAVSAGSRDTMRYRVDTEGAQAQAHADRLLAEGRVVMIQPYFSSVDANGETAMIFIDGAFSHAIRKGPMLAPGREGVKVEGLYVEERITPTSATDRELTLAQRILDALPAGFATPLYARVDVIADAAGVPTLLELELTEPSLFFGHDGAVADRMADAILARLA